MKLNSMIRGRRGWWKQGSWLALLVGGAMMNSDVGQGVAHAQQVVEGSQVSSSDEQEASASGKSGGASDGAEEPLKMAALAVSSIEESSDGISQQLQAARRDRDVVRVLCLGDKLSQVDVALRSAQSRKAALIVALERNDVDRAQHESLVLGVLAARVGVLLGESTQCVGEETGFIGEAEVTLSIDPKLPDDVSGDGALTAFPVLAPPSIGSAID